MGTETKNLAIRIHDPVTIPLEPTPIEPNDIISGEAGGSSVVLYQSADGRAMNGIWRVTPGSFRWNYTCDETIYLLSGRGRITAEGGEPVEFRAGQLLSFPKGLRATWEVFETVRKIFVLSSEEPLA